jgi:hypothetical protein
MYVKQRSPGKAINVIFMKFTRSISTVRLRWVRTSTLCRGKRGFYVCKHTGVFKASFSFWCPLLNILALNK